MTKILKRPKIDFDLIAINDFCKKHHLSEAEREFRFDSKRRWRIDYAFPSIKLAIEIEGGVYIRGRHIRPVGFVKDMEKYNMLTEMGWVLLRYQPQKINFEQILKVYYHLLLK